METFLRVFLKDRNEKRMLFVLLNAHIKVAQKAVKALF